MAAGVASAAPVTTDDTTPDPERAREAPPSGPDQSFLRELLDEHATLSAIVHERARQLGAEQALKPEMRTRVSRDTYSLDRSIGEERQAIAALLRKAFRDNHLPILPTREQSTTDAQARNTPVTGDSAYRRQLVQGLHREQAMIERSMPRLERQDVRALARSIRTSALTRMTALEPAGQH
ncbi:MAG: hypothetical protein ABIT38_18495 [Gemmatimonadaceae bacterium]